MALEVNEIGIRMRVLGDAELVREPGGGGSGGESDEHDRQQELVDTCVRRVLQILKSMQAR